MNPIMKKIYQEIAEEFKTSSYSPSTGLIEKIVNSQFKFVKDIMATGEKNRPETFKTIQLTHLGKFAVRKKKIEFYRKKVEMSVPEGMEFNKSYVGLVALFALLAVGYLYMDARDVLTDQIKELRIEVNQVKEDYADLQDKYLELIEKLKNQ